MEIEVYLCQYNTFNMAEVILGWCAQSRGLALSIVDLATLARSLLFTTQLTFATNITCNFYWLPSFDGRTRETSLFRHK